MTISVLINCYNYERYVVEAVESVLAQGRPADEIIVVDDGSTDDSVRAAGEALAGCQNGRVVSKENGGQLSAFHAGLRETTSDWICFLDADDAYQANHLETFAEHIERHPKVDFFFTDVQEFGEGGGQALHYRGPAGELGFSSMLAIARIPGRYRFAGSVTSALCVRRRILERFLPMSEGAEQDWRVRADNVLVVGSSLAGARKFFIPEKTVRYRLHGSNQFAGTQRDRVENAYWVLAKERMVGELMERTHYRPDIGPALGIEYRGIPKPNSFLRQAYYRAALSPPLPWGSRFRCLLIMLKADCLRLVGK